MKLARTVLIGAFASEASPNKCAADCKTDLKLSDKDCQTGCKNVRNDCPDGIYPVPGEAIHTCIILAVVVRFRSEHRTGS